MDFEGIEANEGVRCTWNYFPKDAASLSVFLVVVQVALIYITLVDITPTASVLLRHKVPELCDMILRHQRAPLH